MKTLICVMLLSCHTPKMQALPLLIAGQFDASTTYYGLNTCTTCYESNPFLRPLASTPAIFPVIQAGDLLAIYLARRVGRRHHKAAYAIIGGLTALHVFAGLHNLGEFAGSPSPTAGPGNKGEPVRRPQGRQSPILYLIHRNK